jgi:hypothetical protein
MTERAVAAQELGAILLLVAVCLACAAFVFSPVLVCMATDAHCRRGVMFSLGAEWYPLPDDPPPHVTIIHIPDAAGEDI